MKYSHVLLTRFGEPTDAFKMVEDELPEPDEGQVREDLRVLLELLSQGKIIPIIGKRLPLQEIAVAHELLEHGQVQGKLVLLPNS